MATPEETAARQLVCELSAIDAADRIRHKNLLLKLGSAHTDCSETSDGFSIRMDPHRMPLHELAEWIELEHLCCPFLTLILEVRAGEADVWLTITGPAGAKPIIAAEIAVRSK
jgi:hypothetical protein